MVVETESAFRHQTISHFIHLFIRNYDRESAADRTMRSEYVPKNIKIQLLAAIRDCGSGATDSDKLSSIANMGLFIHVSCNEIVYYHSITSSVLQWTMSLYVKDVRIKNIVKTVLEDMGRIRDDDIQFILEKYKHMEEERMAGRCVDDGATGISRLLGFLKPKKFQPTTSYFSYYSQSMMLKLAKSILHNSAMFLNADIFNIGPRNTQIGGGPDDLYEKYAQHRERLATMAEKDSCAKMNTALRRELVNENGVAAREPPEEISTLYDQPLSSEDDESDEEEEHEEDRTRSRTTDNATGSRDIPGFQTRPPNSPPHTQDDLEVEEILQSPKVDVAKLDAPPQVSVDQSEDDASDWWNSQSDAVSKPMGAGCNRINTPTESLDDCSSRAKPGGREEKHDKVLAIASDAQTDRMAAFMNRCDVESPTLWSVDDHKHPEGLAKDDGTIAVRNTNDTLAPNKARVCSIYRSVPNSVTSRMYSRLAVDKTTTTITLDGRLQNVMKQHHKQQQCLASRSQNGATRTTMEKMVFTLVKGEKQANVGYSYRRLPPATLSDSVIVHGRRRVPTPPENGALAENRLSVAGDQTLDASPIIDIVD